MNRKSAITAINRAGVLLVFPIDNRREPASLWYHFFPKTEMRWEWDDTGSNRVANLWRLRGELSTTREVVYTKWYRGRATYFSKPLFTAMLRALNPRGERVREGLSINSRRILDILESESPLSPREIKRMTDLQGKENERAYEKAIQELWSRMLVVAFGEIEDSSFPSLAVGATRVVFEDLWMDAFQKDPEDAGRFVEGSLTKDNLFFKHFLKLMKARSYQVESGNETEGGLERKKGRRTGGAQRRLPKVIRFEDL